MTEYTETKPGVPTTTIDQNSPSGWKAFVPYLAYSFIGVYSLTLWTVEFFTVPLDRIVVHFEFSYYLEYLALISLAALFVSSGIFCLNKLLAKRFPRLWKGFFGLVVGFLFGAVVFHRAAMNFADFFGVDEFVWVMLRQNYFAYGFALIVGIVPPIQNIIVKLCVVGAKLLAALPIVMGVYFLSVPTYNTHYDDWPSKAEYQTDEALPAAPVLMIVFDALDKELLFEDEETLQALPTFLSCRENFTYFPNARTSAFHTAESMPAMLYQKDVTREEYNSAIHDGTTPWLNDPTFYDLVGRERDVRIVSGYYVLYSAVLGDRVDCIHNRTLHYPKHHGLGWRVQSHIRLLTTHNYIPILSEFCKGSPYWPEYYVDIGLDMQNDVLESIRRYRGELVGVYHMPWPHPPFVWNRDGPTENESSYLENAEWADTKLAEILSTLRDEGLYENATIIITGDHGYPLATSKHPPLMIKLPKQKAGRIVSDETYNNRVVEWLR
ncbi:sulfatase-like hydrolase/transferase, partial [Planctomycetota bacterium]|nr:sulfatase-like hydrolase/transferase [Planctomycetota bacterium]